MKKIEDNLKGAKNNMNKLTNSKNYSKIISAENYNNIMTNQHIYIQ
jgi:hypothetical protein